MATASAMAAIAATGAATGPNMVDYRVTRCALRHRGASYSDGFSQAWPDRLIQIIAVTAGLVVFGSFLQELLWGALAAATAWALAGD